MVLVVVYSEAAAWACARLLARFVQGISYSPEPGPSPNPARATNGPFDIRLGYRAIPTLVDRLESRGFAVVAQARISERFNRIAGWGLYPPYHEKTQTGLRLIGRDGTPISVSNFPERIYPSFGEVPAPVRETLLFLENRELFDDRSPFRNPAVDWDRFVAAVASFAGGKLLGSGGRFGASTLATQLEKLRHAPGGITRSPGDKARQMASATLRSYLEGTRTTEVRRGILTDYLNALPVGASPGYGEVIGLRDGLRVWFGLDADSADARLRAAMTGAVSGEAARAYRAVVMLLIAQRRPTYYLRTEPGHRALAAITDSHLRLLRAGGTVPELLTRSALAATVEIRATAPPSPTPSFVERKAINATRSRLRGLLGTSSLYELDRFDLTARITIDGPAQRAATNLIRQMGDPTFVRTSGLDTERQLGGSDLGRVAYSFVLYERTPRGNAIRVQVDNLDRPFDLNTGARLELGSTAKLRTLVTYLEIVAELHAELSDTTGRDSTSRARTAQDPISRWAREFRDAHPEADLRVTLEAAMQRRYSANPSERFFTGGGVHVFSNFDRVFDRQSPTVLEGLRHSVNLVYIRLMRDVVSYHEHRLPQYGTGLLEDPGHPARRAFLEQYAEAEGRALVAQYHRKHRALGADSSLALLVGGRVTPARWARLLLAVAPATSAEALAAQVVGRFGRDSLPTSQVRRIRRALPEGLGLADRAFVTGVNPLELWVVSQLRETPEATLDQLQESGAQARREAYAWLLRNTPAVRRAQDRALRIILERAAFAPIRAAWQRLGYPYPDMVPSLGSAIGSSGDRPGALAELGGILVADGIRNPAVRVQELHFAKGTPYEVVLRSTALPGTRVLSPEVAVVARMAMAAVVESGTASLLRGAVRAADSSVVVIGGKTGTGQNEGNRTATFVFYIGDRFYGVATAYVEGAVAERFRFTSGLPVRMVKLLLPRISGLLLTPGAP